MTKLKLAEEIEQFRRIPLFAAFDADALETLAFSLETRLMRTGDLLFRQGEESDGGFVLILGSVGLSPHDDRETTHVVRPWALIGEIALVASSRRPATARALEPSAVLKTTRPFFHLLLEQHPHTAARVHDFSRDRLMAFARHASAGLTGRD